MKQKFLFLTLLLFFLIPNYILADELDIVSPSALLMDQKTGQILYQKNMDEKLYPASTTKVMTALLLLEEGELNKVVTIGKDVPDLIERGSSQIYLIPEEELTREQLLYALLVDSANDAAIAIAQDVSGSTQKFVERMNERAKELGAKNTNFLNPNGLHDDQHYTTARDLSLMAREAMKHPVFRDAVSTERYIIPATNKQDTRYLYITNRLIRKTTYRNYQYEGATGIKTGYTSKANYALVGGASKGDLDLITVLLNAESAEVYEDTHALFDYGFKSFQHDFAIQEGDVCEEIAVGKNNEALALLAGSSFEYCHLKDFDQELTRKVELIEDIRLPIEKGDVMGSAAFYLGSEKLDSVPLLAEKSIEPTKSVLHFLKDFKISLILIGLLGLFLLYRWHIYRKKKRQLKKRIMQRKLKMKN